MAHWGAGMQEDFFSTSIGWVGWGGKTRIHPRAHAVFVSILRVGDTQYAQTTRS